MIAECRLIDCRRQWRLQKRWGELEMLSEKVRKEGFEEEKSG